MRRPNGQGSIYYEKSKKRYAASFITPEGRRIVKRFPTTEEAENWLEDNRYSIRHNTFVTPSGMRTGAWILQYIDNLQEECTTSHAVLVFRYFGENRAHRRHSPTETHGDGRASLDQLPRWENFYIVYQKDLRAS